LAKEFHARGLHVIASARNKETLADLEELGMNIISLEVTSTESREEAKRKVVELTGGKLWGLVNNAWVLFL